LSKAGYEPSAIEAALDRAEQDGYLNDDEYAASLVRRRAPGRGQGLIAQELRAKGVGELAAEPALAQLEPGAEEDRALGLARRLLASRQLADREALLSFLAPRLARRGFRTGVVYRVCRLLADEWEAAGAFDTI
jgi:regulatory protein